MYSAVFFLAGGLIFIYRDKLQMIADKFRWLVLTVGLALTVLYYFVGVNVPIMLAIFSVFLIYAIGNKKRIILNNRVTGFLSGISMEIYLCHMVIFRIIEKVGLTHLFGAGVMSYIATCIGTILGAILFSFIAQKALNFLIKKSTSILSKRKTAKE